MGDLPSYSHSQLLSLDRELVGLGGCEGALRLLLGEASLALAESQGFHELGFSSMAAYDRQRVERGPRWCQDARTVARRLRSLPLVREALIRGSLSWAKAELVARHVRPGRDEEAPTLQQATRLTVRELRAFFATAHRSPNQSLDESEDESEGDERERPTTLTLTMTQNESFILESAFQLMRAMNGPISNGMALDFLLAEARSTLVEGGAIIESRQQNRERAAAWSKQQAHWRQRAEELCDGHVATTSAADEQPNARPAAPPPTELDTPLPSTARQLDQRLRRLSSELAARDLALGRKWHAFCQADGWRRLGFASAAHYARERVGLGISSLKAKRTLCLRVARLPEVRRALEAGSIGYLAAYLLSRVATPTTAAAWVERARHRTIKLLRQEVDRTELALAHAPDHPWGPPTSEEMNDYLTFVAASKSGRAWWNYDSKNSNAAPSADSPAQRSASPTRPDADSPAASVDDGGQSSVAVTPSAQPPPSDSRPRIGRDACLGQLRAVPFFELPLPIQPDLRSAGNGWRPSPTHKPRLVGGKLGVGKVRRRFTVPKELLGTYRDLEAAYLAWGECDASFPVFLAINLWAFHVRALGGRLVKYHGVYERDSFQCSSPVCERRDLNPHHIVFRSHGGSDDPTNLVSLCVWCHLEGVHQRRIQVTGRAGCLEWHIGTEHDLVVADRDLLAA